MGRKSVVLRWITGLLFYFYFCLSAAPFRGHHNNHNNLNNHNNHNKHLLNISLLINPYLLTLT